MEASDAPAAAAAAAIPAAQRQMAAACRCVTIINPQARGNGAVVERALADLARRATVAAGYRTRGDGDDVARIAALIAGTEPDTVIALGGDGTVSQAVQAIMTCGAPRPPALGIVPIGTGNTVARALGLQACVRGDHAAVAAAFGIAVAGTVRRVDLGIVDRRYFVASFAIGMDADILATRNRWCRVLGRGSRWIGYPLYLTSCAVNLLRQHGGPAQLNVDGGSESHRLYNLLVTNTPLYAGEFRFGIDADCDDGALHAHAFANRFEYVRAYVRAWRRHVGYMRTGSATAAPRRCVAALELRFATPVSAQYDGEELPAAQQFSIRIIPTALAVRVPPRLESPQ